MATCPVCNQNPLGSEAERTARLCHPCATKVRPGPQMPELRPKVPCRGCGHTQFVRAALMDQDGELSTKRAGIGTDFRVEHSVWKGDVKEIIPIQTNYKGSLVAYVCRGCGLTELYTEGFATLPIGPQHATELVDVAPASVGPFR